MREIRTLVKKTELRGVAWSEKNSFPIKKGRFQRGEGVQASETFLGEEGVSMSK